MRRTRKPSAKRERQSVVHRTRQFLRRLHLEALEDRRLLAGSYSFEFAAFTSDEGNAPNTVNNVVQILRTGPMAAESVDVTLTGAGATANEDFTAGPVTINFAVGIDKMSVPIHLIGDQTVESDETINLSMANFTAGGVADGPNPTAVFTIKNDDSAALTIENVAQDENAGAMTFTVKLSKAVQGGLTVKYATTDATATTLDNDYAAASGTLTFLGTANETRTFTVLPTGDTKVEANETFGVSLNTLTAATGVPGGTGTIDISDTATGTIANDDSAALTIENVAQDEDAGAMTFTVTLSEAVQGGLTVKYATTDATATTLDNDYAAASGTLTFLGTANETRTFTVLPTGDTKVEANETFGVSLNTLTAATGVPGGTGTIDISDTATVTIANDDSAALTIENVAQDEDAGAMTFTVTLSEAVQGGLTVKYATTDATATTLDNDYAATSGTLTFLGTANETRTFTVLPTGDTKVEADETFGVSLNTLTAATGVPGGTGTIDISDTATGTIANDDSAALTIENVAQDENAGAMTFTVTLSKAVQGGLTVKYATTDATATTLDNDYAAASGTLTFLGTANETRTFTVLPTGDTKVEANETFGVSLNTLTAATGVPGGTGTIDISDTATGTIANDDSAALTIENVTQDENAGAMTFTVTLSEAVQGGLTVKYATTDATATTLDNDYAATSGTLTFLGTANETRTFTVLPTGDTKVEADETFGVSLNTLTAATGVPGGTGTIDISDTATGTITNDDSAALTIENVAQDENAGAMTFTVKLSKAVQGGLTVKYATTDATATTLDNDYAAASGTLTFLGTANETRTFTVLPTGDTKVEADETFGVSLNTLTAATGVPGGTGTIDISDTATGTILNDDTSVSITATDASKAELNSGITTFTFSATRIGNTRVATSVNWTVSGSGTNPANAANAADFADSVLPTGTVTFGIGETNPKTITVNVAGDTMLEADEGFTVTLSNPTGGATLGTAEATGTILNDDTVYDVPVAENGNGNYKILKNGDNLEIHPDAGIVVFAPVAIPNLTINGTAGNETLTVDFSGGNPIPVGGITFNGCSQASGLGDELKITGNTGNNRAFASQTFNFMGKSTGGNDGNVVINDRTVTRTIRFTGLEPISGGDADDTIFNLPNVVGNPNNAIILRKYTTTPPTPNRIEIVDNAGGDFENTNVSNPTNSLRVNLGNQGDTVTLQDMDEGFAPGAASNAFVINGGDGGDTFNIQSTCQADDGTYRGLTINSGSGADVINVSSDASTNLGNLDRIKSPLTIHGNDPAATPGDVLNIGDAGKAGGNKYQLTNTTLNRTSLADLANMGTITYDTVEAFRLDTGNQGNSNDVINIQSTAASTATRINAGAGTDTLTDVDQTKIGAAGLTLDGGGNGESMRIYTANAGPETIGISSTQVTRSTSGTITYAGLTVLSVEGSAAGDTVNVTSTADNGVTQVDAGAGNDVITAGLTKTTLATGVDASVTTLTVADATELPATTPFWLTVGTEFMKATAVAGNSLTVQRGQAGTTAVPHQSGDGAFAALGPNTGLTLNGGSGYDTFTIQPSPQASITINGGAPNGSATPGDSLEFQIPPAQASQLVWNGLYGGTISTTGGFGNISFQSIETTSGLDDYGDAPDTYGTKGAAGARHALTAQGPFLGALIDAEADGQPTTDAKGDDEPNWDDEDGVTFVGWNDANNNLIDEKLRIGGQGKVQVDVSASPASGYVSAWIDFNGDGKFNDPPAKGQPTEKIIDSVFVAAGTAPSFLFRIPVDAQQPLGNDERWLTYARFRISSTPGLGPTNVASHGVAPDGEVEDLQVALYPGLNLHVNTGLAADDKVDTKGSLRWAVAQANASASWSKPACIFIDPLPLQTIQLSTAESSWAGGSAFNIGDIPEDPTTVGTPKPVSIYSKDNVFISVSPTPTLIPDADDPPTKDKAILNGARHFYVAPRADLSLVGITLQGGKAIGSPGENGYSGGGGAAGLGGSIFNEGTLTLRGVAFDGNAAVGGNGGWGRGGADDAGGVVGTRTPWDSNEFDFSGGSGGSLNLDADDGAGTETISPDGTSTAGPGGIGGVGAGGGGAGGAYVPGYAFGGQGGFGGGSGGGDGGNGKGVDGGLFGGAGGTGAVSVWYGWVGRPMITLGGGGGGAGLGGAIFNYDSTSQINLLGDVKFSNNTAKGGTGGKTVNTSGNPMVGTGGDGESLGGAIFNNGGLVSVAPTANVVFTSNTAKTLAPDVYQPPQAHNDTATVVVGSLHNAIAVRANDTFGSHNSADVQILLDTSHTTGTVSVDNSGTPLDHSDDFIRYTPKPGATPGSSDSFTYTLEPLPSGLSSTATVTITVTGAPAPSPLTNSLRPCDVNDDGTVAPSDALILINYLDAPHGATPVSAASGPPAEGEASVKYYYDVNGDQYISALDALLVILQLNQAATAPAGGEGESAPTEVSAAPAAAPVSAFAPLTSIVAVVSHEDSSAVVAAAPNAIPGTQSVSPLDSAIPSARTTSEQLALDDVLSDDLVQDICSAWALGARG